MKTLTHVERVVKALSGKRLKFKELQDATKLSPSELNESIANVRKERSDLMFGKFDKCYWFSMTPTWYSNQTDLSQVLPAEGKVGIISDTHLCSVAERLELVNEAYDTFAAAGIKHVFHMGD